MKISNILTIFILVTFLAAPAASTLLIGYDQSAESGLSWADVNWHKMVHPDERYRNKVAKDFVTNGLVGFTAIRSRSTLDYLVFGHVNTPEVISGRGKWLFYKPSFKDGACLPQERIETAVNTADAMRITSLGAGIDFRLAVAPDKEVVYPEELGMSAFALAGCKLSSALKWRRYAQQQRSSLIDELQAMDPLLGDSMYYETDTHWNEFGMALALRQLAVLYTGRDPGIPGAQYQTINFATDMLKMLRLNQSEQTKTFPAYWSGQFARAIPNRLKNAVIYHDSFFANAKDQLSLIFDDPQFFHHLNPAGLRDAIIAKPRFILVETVERGFFDNILGGFLSWNSELGLALITANRNAAAEKCKFEVLNLNRIELRRIVATQDNHFEASDDSQMYIKLPSGGRPCFSIKYSTSTTSLSRTYLPKLHNGERFRVGFSVNNIDQIGVVRTVQMVLPEDFAGETIRFDPVDSNSALYNIEVATGLDHQAD